MNSAASEKLRESIEGGDFPAVKSQLDDVTDYVDVKELERLFTDRDPVVCAIDNNQEKIAVYLVEKMFSIDKYYCWPGLECEPYCYATHEGKKCSGQYDALDLATKLGMNFLCKVISDIKCGKRQAGDSLSKSRRISSDSSDSVARRQFMTEISEQNQDKYQQIATQLDTLITEGDFIAVKRLLNPIVQISEVENILVKYPERDPLIHALKRRQEKIACYLIEKRFPYNLTYDYPGQECDEWCSRLHESRRCPNQYTALDKAKKNQLRSVQGLIESIMAGTHIVGSTLKFERQVSLESMPVFSRDVIMATEEYRLATTLSDLIDAGDLEGVKKLIQPINDPVKVNKIEYVFDDRDPVTYAVDNDKTDIADYLISKRFTFTNLYWKEGVDCDEGCYTQHINARCPGSYTAMTLAETRGHSQLHRNMLLIKQGGP